MPLIEYEHGKRTRLQSHRDSDRTCRRILEAPRLPFEIDSGKHSRQSEAVSLLRDDLSDKICATILLRARRQSGSQRA